MRLFGCKRDYSSIIPHEKQVDARSICACVCDAIRVRAFIFTSMRQALLSHGLLQKCGEDPRYLCHDVCVYRGRTKRQGQEDRKGDLSSLAKSLVQSTTPLCVCVCLCVFVLCWGGASLVGVDEAGRYLPDRQYNVGYHPKRKQTSNVNVNAQGAHCVFVNT